MDSITIEYFSKIDAECDRCNRCNCVHKGVGFPDFNYGDLAKMLLELNEESKEPEMEYKRFIQSCDYCGACTVDCPIDVNAKTFISKARTYLIELDPSIKENYRNVRVDLKYNLFSCLQDAADEKCEESLSGGNSVKSLFFPSCHMASKFPALVNKSYDYLKEAGIVDGMTSYCCGNTLFSAGMTEEFDPYAKSLVSRIEEAGVERIVTPCANCHDFFNRLKQMDYLEGNVEILALPQVMNEEGIRANGESLRDVNITIHDSCPDRKAGIFGQNIRDILEDFQINEMKERGKATLSCGAGGLSPFGAKDAADIRKKRKAERSEKVEAEILVTTCTNCADCFHSTLNEMKVQHFLEFVVEEEADWHAYDQAKKKINSEGHRYAEKMKDTTSKLFD